MRTDILEYIRIPTGNTNTVRLHFHIAKLPPLGTRIPEPSLSRPLRLTLPSLQTLYVALSRPSQSHAGARHGLPILHPYATCPTAAFSTQGLLRLHCPIRLLYDPLRGRCDTTHKLSQDTLATGADRKRRRRTGSSFLVRPYIIHKYDDTRTSSLFFQLLSARGMNGVTQWMALLN